MSPLDSVHERWGKYNGSQQVACNRKVSDVNGLAPSSEITDNPALNTEAVMQSLKKDSMVKGVKGC